ncbi:putative UDP-rhamnose:rhamnosyltransferase 1, partial [Mucuna pruriens]
MAEEHQKLHIAVFPWLAFGHIGPFFELAKQIAQKGHKISFISTPRNIHRLPKLPENLQTSVDLIEFPLPHVDKLPQNAEATVDIPLHIIPYLKKAFDGLEEPLTKFLERCTPDWIICDFAPYWLPPISSKLGISCIFFSIFSAFDLFRVLEILNGTQVIASRSCMEIEGESFKLLESICRKPVIPVGLLPPSLQFNEGSKDHDWNTILNWLDEQEKGSVLYVAFGSEVILSDEDFTEIAMGLELSGFPYFWVLKKQNTSAIESQDRVESQSKRGLVWRTWAPQLRILAHKSVGGFLTHCGWSSVIEGLQVGCPLIMLPFQNEQSFVARLMEEKKVGIKVPKNEHDGKFTRDSVAKALRSVMLEEEGKTCRSQAEVMSKIFGDKELHQKYVDEFVDYMEIHRPSLKD